MDLPTCTSHNEQLSITLKSVSRRAASEREGSPRGRIVGDPEETHFARTNFRMDRHSPTKLQDSCSSGLSVRAGDQQPTAKTSSRHFR